MQAQSSFLISSIPLTYNFGYSGGDGAWGPFNSGAQPIGQTVDLSRSIITSRDYACSFVNGSECYFAWAGGNFDFVDSSHYMFTYMVSQGHAGDNGTYGYPGFNWAVHFDVLTFGSIPKQIIKISALGVTTFPTLDWNKALVFPSFSNLGHSDYGTSIIARTPTSVTVTGPSDLPRVLTIVEF